MLLLKPSVVFVTMFGVWFVKQAANETLPTLLITTVRLYENTENIPLKALNTQ